MRDEHDDPVFGPALTGSSENGESQQLRELRELLAAQYPPASAQKTPPFVWWYLGAMTVITTCLVIWWALLGPIG